MLVDKNDNRFFYFSNGEEKIFSFFGFDGVQRRIN